MPLPVAGLGRKADPVLPLLDPTVDLVVERVGRGHPVRADRAHGSRATQARVHLDDGHADVLAPCGHRCRDATGAAADHGYIDIRQDRQHVHWHRCPLARPAGGEGGLVPAGRFLDPAPGGWRGPVGEGDRLPAMTGRALAARGGRFVRRHRSSKLGAVRQRASSIELAVTHHAQRPEPEPRPAERGNGFHQMLRHPERDGPGRQLHLAVVLR